MMLSVRPGEVTGKVRALDVPPPGAGVITVIETEAAPAMSLTGTLACSSVLDTKVVCSALPFHCTVDVETKFDPFAVRVKEAPPASAPVGLSDVSAGTGFPLEPGFEPPPEPEPLLPLLLPPLLPPPHPPKHKNRAAQQISGLKIRTPRKRTNWLIQAVPDSLRFIETL